MNNKGQIALELLIAIAIYTTLITTTLQIHSKNYREIRKRRKNIEVYREISRTSDMCTYKYFHGPSIKIKENYSSSAQANQNKLIQELDEIEIIAKSFSPQITLTEGKIKCKSLKHWYQ
ncbi:MAG: hypothetical protein ACOCTT_01665 [archaeon]